MIAITFNNFWLPLGVMLFSIWLGYMIVFITVETIKKNKGEGENG
jgi:hypothetical protein